tara:strand:+ start:587 stop:1123 length:537 start_codon:yes stop_codon:yes gene_type:complete
MFSLNNYWKNEHTKVTPIGEIGDSTIGVPGGKKPNGSDNSGLFRKMLENQVQINIEAGQSKNNAYYLKLFTPQKGNEEKSPEPKTNILLKYVLNNYDIDFSQLKNRIRMYLSGITHQQFKPFRPVSMPRDNVSGIVYYLGCEKRPDNDPNHMLAKLEDKIDELYGKVDGMTKVQSFKK